MSKNYPKVPRLVCGGYLGDKKDFPSEEDFHRVLDVIADDILFGKRTIEEENGVAQDIVLDFMDSVRDDIDDEEFEDSMDYVEEDKDLADGLRMLWDNGYPLNMLYFFVPEYTAMIADGRWCPEL